MKNVIYSKNYLLINIIPLNRHNILIQRLLKYILFYNLEKTLIKCILLNTYAKTIY